MARCFNCGTSQAQKRWYSFHVERKKLSYLDKIDVKNGTLTRLLCKDCAKIPELAAQPTSNPHN